MLPAANRMRSSVEFAAAIRRGRRAGRRTLVLHYRPGTTSAPDAGPGPARVGLVVSKAVGSSVVRNRVKRRLRHLMSERLSALEPGSLLVVRANPASSATDAALGRDLDGALGTVIRGAAT